MKATFSSTKQIDFKPIDNNETVLLEHMKDIANNQLSFVKDEKYGDISLVIDEPRNVTELDNLANRIIHMDFPTAIRDLIDSHTIMKMKDGSYIDCLVITEEEPTEPETPDVPSDVEIPSPAWNLTPAEEEGKTVYTCTCGLSITAANDDEMYAILGTEYGNHPLEEHERMYKENHPELFPVNESTETKDCNLELTEANEKYQSTVPEGYYVDPSAPCGYRKCRPGHIHGATYMHPDCCICEDHLASLMKRTILVRLVSETLGEVVLFSLVGIDDVRINTKVYKVETTADMSIIDVNKNSLFYDCFKI